MDITVFLGAPGSGKGTQAKRLAQAHGFIHFSTGDMLRAAMAQGAEIGKKAKSFIDRGELVPDGLMIELIEDALNPLEDNARVVLDGFPRTVPQAQALDDKPLTTVRRAIYFKVPTHTLIERLTGRRICEKCGEPFNIAFVPPKVPGICDRCGGKLVQRNDDAESVVRRRLEVFYGQNEQLLSYYKTAGKLSELEADIPVASLQDKLIQLLR